MANKSFLGTGMKFPPQIDPATGRFMTVSGNKTVKEALYIILMTQTTERIVHPEFGSSIMTYAFMDTGTTVMSMFKREITQTILSQEPRIADIDVNLEYNENQGAIIINIDYLVAATNSRDNLVFPFYLDRGADQEEEAGESADADYYRGEDGAEYVEEEIS